MTDVEAHGQIITADANSMEYLKSTLLNVSGSIPLHERFRALFTLKNLAGDECVDIIGQGFSDESALLKHELAYVLGQMGNLKALPILSGILEDKHQDVMVRHEAAEALGALGNVASLPILEEYLHDENVTIRETCQLAIERIKYNNNAKKEKIPDSGYTSIDPAPPSTETTSVDILQKQLMDTKLPLFERYRAMFALRNIGNTEAVEALATGFADSSALFRHEIAYVFGQMQHPASVPSLITTLTKTEEVDMVRHEAAEALGSIATPEVFPLLDAFRKDNDRVVRESCEVALDMYEYETSGAFQYADGLAKTENMHTMKQAIA
ncbi:hypothetical protein BZG36_01417 [Bifiguratus adelaidae]|uniref:Deoxyhypusine hydroxylase n=1 Tax=Bifiguratus adelaidae TaxID=1938954 RepID=A0A261Y506_9FUNG|nr:hypothetical protein BZG36_01417 [Bifiguratus adelaidae]